MTAGIHVTAVEPGLFRTDFLAPTSMGRAAYEIVAYRKTAGRMRESSSTLHGQQPEDPTKLAQALLQLASAPNPPLQLPLGNDTLQRIAEKNAFVEQEVSLAEATGF